MTVPAKHGDPRNLTNTPDAHERGPVWSPDGARIAYLSDASGEYRLHVAPQRGDGEVKEFELRGAGYPMAAENAEAHRRSLATLRSYLRGESGISVESLLADPYLEDLARFLSS